MFETPEEFRRRVGSVELGPASELVFRTRGEVLGRFAVALLFLVGVVAAAVAVAPLSPWPQWPTVMLASSAFCVYCAIGYFVRPRANHDELGDFSVRSELSFSDDVNRAMLLVRIVLAPGRFISASLVDALVLVGRGQLPQERYVEKASVPIGLPRT